MQEPATVSTETPISGSGPRRRGLLLAPALIFAAVVLMFAFALQKGDPSKLPSALIGKPAPALDLPPLDGLALAGGQPAVGLTRQALTAGKVSVVNFWASWCGPCVEEHPLLVKLSGNPDIHLYGINYKDAAVNARRFLGRYGNPFSTVGVDATSGRSRRSRSRPSFSRRSRPLEPGDSAQAAAPPSVCGSAFRRFPGDPKRRSRYPPTADSNEPTSTPSRSGAA
jgi:cytochrome c biogenesis protein CcmG/thiol:disulfide interchange protein DsbE